MQQITNSYAVKFLVFCLLTLLVPLVIMVVVLAINLVFTKQSFYAITRHEGFWIAFTVLGVITAIVQMIEKDK